MRQDEGGGPQGAAAAAASQPFAFSAHLGRQESGRLPASACSPTVPQHSAAAPDAGRGVPNSTWHGDPSNGAATGTAASGQQHQLPPRSKKQRQQPTKAADTAKLRASGRAKPRTRPAKPAARRTTATIQAAGPPRPATSAPGWAGHSAAAAATTTMPSAAGGALLCHAMPCHHSTTKRAFINCRHHICESAPMAFSASRCRLFLVGRATVPAQQVPVGGASGTLVEESSLDGMFTGSMFDALPAPSLVRRPAAALMPPPVQ